MSSAGGESDIKGIRIGYLPWWAPNGEIILIKCYHSPQAVDTIISPSDIVSNHITKHKSWTHHADFKTNDGYIAFTNKKTGKTTKYPLRQNNGLWYFFQVDAQDYQTSTTPIIRQLTSAGKYHLYHARLGHHGVRAMSQIHLHCKGIPKLKIPTLYRCSTCVMVNATKRAVSQKEITKITSELSANPKQTTMTEFHEIQNQENNTNYQPGQRFHMDFGFVRGTQYGERDSDGSLVTSLDRYNSYLLVIDRATRYTWVFLSRNKAPPIDTIKQFLAIHGTTQTTQKFIRTDEGGELWGSHKFQQAIKDAGFIMEATAPDASFQNGLAERPNRTYGDMMRSLLHTANLGPEYWSWALLHATYLKKRIPHRTIWRLPYEAYTGQQPELTRLRVFRSPVIV